MKPIEEMLKEHFFQEWLAENKDRLSDLGSSDAIKIVWSEWWTKYHQKCDENRKHLDLYNAECAKICERIAQVRKNLGIPAKDNWVDGMEAIAGFCEQIASECRKLRKELDNV